MLFLKRIVFVVCVGAVLYGLNAYGQTYIEFKKVSAHPHRIALSSCRGTTTLVLEFPAPYAPNNIFGSWVTLNGIEVPLRVKHMTFKKGGGGSIRLVYQKCDLVDFLGLQVGVNPIFVEAKRTPLDPFEIYQGTFSLFGVDR